MSTATSAAATAASTADGRAASRPRHTHSPRVRRLAETAGIDLSHVVGTGSNGRVSPADISAADANTADMNTAVQQAQPAAADDVTTYIVELDLTSAVGRDGSRADALGTVAHALLAAVRRVSPVTDVEIVSAEGKGTGLIPRAHDLTQAALISRIETGPAVASTALGPTMAVIDAAYAGSVFTVAGPAPDRLLSASLGPVESRPVARPGATGHPDISFRMVAFLGIGCRSADLGTAQVIEILSTTAARLNARDGKPRTRP